LCGEHPVELARGIVTQVFEAGQSLLKVRRVRQGGVQEAKAAVSTPPPDPESDGPDEPDLRGPQQEPKSEGTELWIH